MKTSKINTKGQIVIPFELRKKHGIKIGTKIYFEEENDTIKMFPLTGKTIDKNIGLLGTEGKLLKIFIKEKELSKFK